MRLNQPVTNNEYILSDTEAIVSMTDLKGKITYVNPYFIEASGYSADELLGKPHNLLRHPDMPPAAFADLWTTIQQGIPWSGVVKNRRKNGDFYWVEANVTPVYDNGKMTGYMSVRHKPSREIIGIVTPIYRQFLEGKANGIAIYRGGVVPTGWRRYLRVWQDLNMSVRLALGQGVLALGMGGMGLAALLGYGPTGHTLTVLCMGGMAVAFWQWVTLSKRLKAPVEQALRVARAIAGGDMTAKIESQGGDEIGQLLLALRQVLINLNTIVRDVRSNVDVMKVSSSDIAAGNLNLSHRTETQAASLQQTAASLEQFVANMRQGAENAEHANQLAAKAAEVAQKGGQVITNFDATMNDINSSASKIIDIIALIDGIAFQTNILALNASVEAARAGEQGRGFSVVAGEVRNLAGRSASAAKEIKALIGDSIAKIQAGSRQVSDATTTMEEIVNTVTNVSHIMSELAVLTKEQEQGIGQINDAVVHLDQVTQKNAALVEETAAASDTVVQQATHMQQTVGVFKLARSSA